MKEQLTLCIDIDGTITRTIYPDIVGFKRASLKYVNKLFDSGRYCVILWTCRTGKHFDDAIRVLRARGYKFHYANENNPVLTEKYGNDSRKLGADMYVDDKAVSLFGLPPWFFIYWIIRLKTYLIDRKSVR